ncbi:isochorismate synthase [Nocardioidaceae bacterium]|nr:isochorismate synthase [Nocardioidaceae bacterium]
MTDAPAPRGLAAPAPTLVTRTRGVEDPGALLDLLPADAACAWLRGGDGLVGWGEAARVEFAGADRFEAADRWWREATEAAVVRDEVGVPGTGLVCFGSFAFADEPGRSILVVPEVVVGRRGETVWVSTTGTSLGPAPRLRPTDAPRPPGDLEVDDDAAGRDRWTGAVAEAVSRIEDGGLEKVVLARDVHARHEGRLDVRWPLRRLAEDYPTCWTFHVDGLFGATPEMLVRLERGLVTSRVLAGTIQRSGDEVRDLSLGAALSRSSKDLEEHEYAVRSVADRLAAHCTSMNVPERPFVLELPNVLHLATDVAGVSSDDASALRLAAALHPSAAVGGTPTEVAVELIAELEGMDRGRYAGPVGWMDARGDGEWGIALRSAEVTEEGVRLFAGCGIVAGSRPEAELAESDAKLVPVTDALS